MCGLYGVFSYGNSNIENLNEIVSTLAIESSERGTDATGISYVYKNEMQVYKRALSAYKMKFKIPQTVKVVMGHTRHSTHGDCKKNYNNHPFLGTVKNSKFTLAHNGVLYDTDMEKVKYSIPKTNIETDSYIAVQLIEKKRKLDFDSISFMAETVRGSFTFSILDDKNILYLVKGDNPMSILHFPKLKLYVYASTEKILWRTIIDSSLLKHIKKSPFEEIKINCGDILRIAPNGKLTYTNFDYVDYDYSFNWYNYGCIENDCLDELKTVCSYYGYEPKHIHELCGMGYTYDEIEEMLYEPSYFDVAINEI